MIIRTASLVCFVLCRAFCQELTVIVLFTASLVLTVSIYFCFDVYLVIH